jgi:signal peptidase II
VAVLFAAGAILLLDQATKALAIRFLSPAAAGGARVLKVAANRNWWIGRPPSIQAVLALWGLVLGCTVLELASTTSSSHHMAGAGLAVAFAGATGNLLDRVGRGAVIDFIALGRWPAFNLADVAIVAGVLVAAGSVA